MGLKEGSFAFYGSGCIVCTWTGRIEGKHVRTMTRATKVERPLVIQN